MGTEFWGRSILIGTIAGALVGMIVGGTLGRIYMRVLALAQDEALGFQTAMGAIVGDLTVKGRRKVHRFRAAKSAPPAAEEPLGLIGTKVEATGAALTACEESAKVRGRPDLAAQAESRSDGA